MSGALVEIIEDGGEPGMVVYNQVRINGTDVGWIAAGGVHVDPGDPSTPVTVTLTLLPREVRIIPGEYKPRHLKAP